MPLAVIGHRSDKTAADVLSSLPYAEEVAKLAGLPVVMTCAEESLAGELQDKVNNLFPLHLQKRPV